MIKVKSRKKAIAAFAFVVVALVITVSLLVHPTSAAGAEIDSKRVFVKAKGVAFERIDNVTIKQSNVELTLTLELGKRRGIFIPLPNMNGSISVNGTVYTINGGKGFIQTRRHVALIRCVGVDSSGDEVILGIHSAYFWWGGNLYAFRAKALLRTAENPMLLLLRGVGKVY